MASVWVWKVWYSACTWAGMPGAWLPSSRAVCSRRKRVAASARLAVRWGRKVPSSYPASRPVWRMRSTPARAQGATAAASEKGAAGVSLSGRVRPAVSTYRVIMVAICSRVTGLLGEKVPFPVPSATPVWAAQAT